jgi:ribosomal protein S28E/S33
VVEVRLSGTAEDTATVISVLERIAAGLPVTTVRLEILHRSGARANRRDSGEPVYVLVRVTGAGQ